MPVSPILLFVYNRPWHTRQTVEALLKNDLATESDLFVYADGSKNFASETDVVAVRDYIKNIEGFSSITLVERDENWGLAANIIEGVTKVIQNYGKVIVLEDDIVTSPTFLKFMNHALDFYKNEEKIWHISGWNYPIDSTGLSEAFLWRVMNCWGWATWSDRWEAFEKNSDQLLSEFSRRDISRFNLDNSHDFWSQVEMNKAGQIDTWAIYWYASIFRRNGLCVGPTESLVQNIGFDGSGVHCRNSKTMQVAISSRSIHKMPSTMVEDEETVDRIRKFLLGSRGGLMRRVAAQIKRLLRL